MSEEIKTSTKVAILSYIESCNRGITPLRGKTHPDKGDILAFAMQCGFSEKEVRAVLNEALDNGLIELDNWDGFKIVNPEYMNFIDALIVKPQFTFCKEGSSVKYDPFSIARIKLFDAVNLLAIKTEDMFEAGDVLVLWSGDTELNTVEIEHVHQKHGIWSIFYKIV